MKLNSESSRRAAELSQTCCAIEIQLFFPLRLTLGYDLSTLQPVCVEICISWRMLSSISNVKRINGELEGVTYFRHTFCKATYISSEGCKRELSHSSAQLQLFCCPKQEASARGLSGNLAWSTGRSWRPTAVWTQPC